MSRRRDDGKESRCEEARRTDAGNAGGALAAYGARAGLEAVLFMPRDTPRSIMIECRELGAKWYWWPA